MNFISLDSLLSQLSFDILFKFFIKFWPLNLPFDQLLFKINLNLGINFQGLSLKIEGEIGKF